MIDNNFITKFSKNLFWDVRCEDINIIRHAPYIVQRVLEYGTIEDWDLLKSLFGLSKIVDIATRLRSLDDRALSYLSIISKTPKESFRCYISKQSVPQHCNL